MPAAADAGNRRRIAWGLGAGVLLAGFLALGLFHVVHGRINQDEGWYLYAARRVAEGAHPYRDFAFFQAPLTAYVHAPAQALLGGGLQGGRLTSLALSCVTVALGARLAFLHGGPLAALLFLAFVCLTPQQIWAFTTTRTEPLNAFWLMLSAFLLLGRSPGPGASAGALLSAVLAAATRASSAPALLLVAVWVVVRHRHSARQLALAVAPGLAALLPLGALVLAASPEVVWFNVVGHATQRHDQLAPAEAWGLLRHLEERLKALYVLHMSYGVVPLLGLGCAGGVLALWLGRGRAAPPLVAAGAGLAGLALAAYAANLRPRMVHAIYFASVFPLLLVLLCGVMAELRRRGGRGARAALAVGIALALLLQLATAAGTRKRFASREDPDLAELREAATYLASRVPPGGVLASLDTYLAVESRRRVPPGWEMGLFAFHPALPEQEARRYRVLSPADLERELRSRTLAAVALSDRALGILAERRETGYRHFQRLGEADLQRALPGLEGYRLDRVFPRFGQSRDNLYLLLPAERPLTSP